MTTIPARLARSVQARKRALKLYRDWYRGAPEIVSIYALNVSPAFIRHCVRQHFEQNRYVSDTRVVDVLLHKGRVEYQETMNCWKQLDHIMGILLQPKGRPPRTFLQKFYEGRDEDAVLPAATGIINAKTI
ncbi:NADH-ubiquinone oxidoreductase Complex1 subunit [Epithele typhae]|uniref:NADH-ubiquinone oxidoreductase Complex1 subunit n=1 Tax=Epithele typhae TaxID=378194 RepID=UPI0020080555|nr:NADH-ubiquinone oxidoreductase Complex1 subunit [Epithele typhae]KAH9920893.1 NADH-ubiquinone oxidoreductase Complex1 subunit [Epithele typhae]